MNALAVSHVIGEILMVALTVAIVATLFFYCNMSMPDVERPSWLNQLFGYSTTGGSQGPDGQPTTPPLDEGGPVAEKGGGGKSDNPPSVSNVKITRTNLPDTGYVKDGDDLHITADIDDEDLETIIILADLSLLVENGGAEVPPSLFEDTVATWILENNDFTVADGNKIITITVQDVYESEASDQGSVYVDNTPPGSISGFIASPGHNKVTMSWTNPGGSPDLDVYGIIVRRTTWGSYPTYSGSGPSYPTATTGSIVLQQTGLTTSYVDTFDSQGRNRDICYYQAFVYDKAYNYGPASSGAQGRATNYWLGDVEPRNDVLGTIGDGYVTQADIDAMSATYYVPTSSPLWNPHCDVGPTYDWSSTGIPNPDGSVSFEDMMIFAMNKGVVSP